MREHNLNQAKSKGGSHLSEQAVSGYHLCSLCEVCTARLLGRKMNIWIVKSKPVGTVGVRHCEGAAPGKRDSSGKIFERGPGKEFR